ncbi:MAG: helix-turn-helix transcriptional regulator [Caldilineaceae bacterium]
MRADRLVSLLLLLQTRGRMTAQQLASELEVSERTIYRDVDALSIAGIPIYGDPGHDGGYALLDSYRTTLTGLSEGEARALFLLSLPTPLADLGIGQELKAALLKLNAAMPSVQSESAERVRNRVLLDPVWWDQAEEPPTHLPDIHCAVWQDRRLWIRYRTMSPPDMEREVEPYALVAKAGVWYLICRYGENLHVHRVLDLLGAQPLETQFVRSEAFDLSAFWADWCALRRQQRRAYVVRVRVSPRFKGTLTRYFGDAVRKRLDQAGPPDEEGWLSLDLTFGSLEEARERILSFGGGVEVLEPYALRRSVQDYAEQIAQLYSRSQDDLAESNSTDP